MSPAQLFRASKIVAIPKVIEWTVTSENPHVSRMPLNSSEEGNALIDLGR
jgi:hypothetical protein